MSLGGGHRLFDTVKTQTGNGVDSRTVACLGIMRPYCIVHVRKPWHEQSGTKYAKPGFTQWRKDQHYQEFLAAV